MSSVDVVIPVYKDLRLTQRCIESVLEANDPMVGRLIVVDDCSPEHEVSQYCRDLCAEKKIELVVNTSNLGFVQSVNIGMQASSSDVILLNSDTRVHGAWASRLFRCAGRAERVASVTPFSNNAEIASYPHFVHSNVLPRDLSLSELDNIFSNVNDGMAIEIPTAVGFCMYLRREVLQEIGLFDADLFGRGYGEENDWCLRASSAGYRHLLCADLFVYHEGGASFGNETEDLKRAASDELSVKYPGYAKSIATFVTEDPIEPARYAVDLARPDTAVVIAEYRERAAQLHNTISEIDQCRHDQVCRLEALLQSTRDDAAAQAQDYDAALESLRGEAQAESAQYAALLDAERAEWAQRDGQYAAQIKYMAEELNRVRARVARYDRSVVAKLFRWLKGGRNAR